MELIKLTQKNLPYQVTNNFACNWSRDGRIFVLMDTSLFILEFDINMKNTEDSLTFYQDEIQLSSYHPANDTKINYQKCVFYLPRNLFNPALLDYNITPCIPSASSVPTHPVAAEWSPAEFPNEAKSLLAVVSSNGNVEIYMNVKKNYVCIENLVKTYLEYVKKNWNTENDDEIIPDEEQTGQAIQNDSVYNEAFYTKKYECHKDRVKQIFSTCVCWSPTYENNLTCYIAIGHLNGTISIWKCQFHSENNEFKFTILSTFPTSLNQLNILHWHKITENSALLIFGSVEGVVQYDIINIENVDNITVNESKDIWSDKDVAVKSIHFVKYNNNNCFLMSKGSALLLSILDAANNCSTKFLDLGNYLITGIEIMKPNNFLVITMTGALKLITINDNLNMEVSEIITDLTWDLHSAKGIVKSPQKNLWGILTFPCKMFDHLTLREAVQLVFLTFKDYDPRKCLFDNPQNSLAKNWECFEIMRCSAAKNNILPCSLLNDNRKFSSMSLYELQIHMWLIISCQEFVRFNTKLDKHNFEHPSPTEFKKILFFAYYVERLKSYMVKNINDELEIESIVILKGALNKFLSTSIFEIYLSDLREEVVSLIEAINEKFNNYKVSKCHLCDSELNGLSCDNRHIDQRCCVSGLQLVNGADYFCRICDLPVHEKFAKDNRCPCCDMNFVKTHY